MNLFDLAASIVGGLTAITVSSLVFADRILKRDGRKDQTKRLDPDGTRAAITEKRRVFLEKMSTDISISYTERTSAFNELKRLNEVSS